MPNSEPVADGGPVAGWAPVIEDPALEATAAAGRDPAPARDRGHLGRGSRLAPG